MLPWIEIDKARVPGGGELRLKRRGAEFSIMLGSNELMNSRLSGSEETLASLACACVAQDRSAVILIGGLGMGFTLRAALQALKADARVTIAEIVPELVGWARGPLAEIFAGCLDDPRVSVEIADVAKLIRKAGDQYDAILLDVDNGPDGLSREENDALYDTAGLAAALAALKPGGVLAVWSSARDGAFTARLRRAGFQVEEKMARAHGKRGAKHTIWLAVRPLA
ncbi:MAG: hypothetical protein JNL61_18785 [Rhizobiaceae bacterium]|nr:hypothetical protein [Rhizobiaceae bacterium]